MNATDLAGNEAEYTFQVKVSKTVFARGGYITLSPQKQRIMMDRSKSREDNTKRGAAYAKADRETEQLWEGKFIRPTSGRLTSPFGKYREYNTGVRRHHYGTDIANVVGTPVYASNRGIVTLADRLHIYGNAVILNHGQEVSTSYNHLSEIHVKAGERVEKGQRIGLMGATGQATGSHLHWGMVVRRVAVAPEEWTERDFSSPGTREITGSEWGTQMNKLIQLEQIVPGKVCFSCDICCRFLDQDSFLAPIFTQAEMRRAIANGVSPESLSSHGRWEKCTG